MIIKTLQMLLLALCASGCATVSTYSRVNGAQGIAYHLPKGKFRLTVSEASGVLSVEVGGPLMIPDGNFPLVARIPRGNLSDNTVTITLDDKTTLLKKVDVSSTGRVTDIGTNLAKAFALQSSVDKVGIVIFDKAFDLDELPAGADQASSALQRHFANVCTRRTADALPLSAELKAAGFGDDVASKEIIDRLVRCRQLSLAGAPAASTNHLIRITVDRQMAARSDRLGAKDAFAAVSPNCARGVCYRPLVPVDLTLSVLGAFERSDVFLVPDEGTVLFIDLAGGAFATQKYTLDFTDGVLSTYKQDSQSEFVGLVSLPVAVLTAVLSAPAEALGLKKKNLEAETSYLSAVDKRAEAAENTAELCQRSATLCPATAYRIIGGAITPDPVAAAGGSAPVEDADNVP